MLSSTSLLMFSVLFIGVHGRKFHKWDPLQEGCQYAPINNYPVETFHKKDLLVASVLAFDDLSLHSQPDCKIKHKVKQEFTYVTMCEMVKLDKESNTVIIETYTDFCFPDSKLPGIICLKTLCRQKKTKAEYEKTHCKMAKSKDDGAVFLAIFLCFCIVLFSILILVWKYDDSYHGSGRIPKQLSAKELKRNSENVEDDEDSGEESTIELESEDDTQSETEFDSSSSDGSFEVIEEETNSVE